MTAYRFYYVGSDGHISMPPSVAEFPDDHDAIEAAQALVDGKAIEVWDGHPPCSQAFGIR